MKQIKPDIIKANWHAPKHILAFCTTRQGGISQAPFDSLNLGAHVGDKKLDVEHNRQTISQAYQLPCQPLWLKQTHSTKAINSTEYVPNIEADAIISQTNNQVLAVMTADCLPILLCNQQGNEVAAIHAGWKGLSLGILRRTVEQMQSSNNTLLAWLGPCISQTHFEVGAEVFDAFAKIDPNYQCAFYFNKQTQKYYANLQQLAINQLKTLNIRYYWQAPYCTYQDKERFFSYRRQKITGRMCSFISIIA